MNTNTTVPVFEIGFKSRIHSLSVLSVAGYKESPEQRFTDYFEPLGQSGLPPENSPVGDCAGRPYDRPLPGLSQRHSVPIMSKSQEWKVTISGQIEEVTDGPRFLALFEAALTSDPEVIVIQFNEPSWPHMASAVLLISAADLKEALAMGQVILSRNMHVAAQATIGDQAYGRAFQVGAQLLSSPLD